MSPSRAFTPRLDRILARRQRQMFTDLIIWSLVTAGLFAMALAV